MKDFPGTPGTLTALVLRILQLVFAAGAFASMATTISFFNFTAFWRVILACTYCDQSLKDSFEYSHETDVEQVLLRRYSHCPYVCQSFIDWLCIIRLSRIGLPKSVVFLSCGRSSLSWAGFLLPFQRFFIYLIASMGLQVIWSFWLAILDADALLRKKVLHSPVLVSLFVVGDWVTATLSLAAASSSAGIVVLYFNDIGSCSFGDECHKYQMSVALAYMSWITIAISSLIMLWVLAAGISRKIAEIPSTASGIN